MVEGDHPSYGNSLEDRMERLERQVEETQKMLEELLRILKGRGTSDKENKDDR